jgi:beta-glucosidase
MAAVTRRLQVDVGLKKDPGNPGGVVVQLYFSQSMAQAVRPRLMLLAFAKVDRATSDMVTLTIPLEDLGYYHPLTGATTVDAGSYTLFVGRSAADICATTSLNVTS